MTKLLKLSRILLLSGLLMAASTALEARAATPTITVLEVKGIIVPLIADYIDRGISQAEKQNDTAVIIQLNTPGGLLDSTERIVGRIMNAKIPVVVYVAPKGAWAASAGTFITLSAHIAAMTPGTTIGAAHPVTTGGQQLSETEMKKVTEFSAKWMKTIAQERKRNIKEAELAVTESKSFTDGDALQMNLIDLRAESLSDLLTQINGQQMTLSDNTTVTINTTNYTLYQNNMTLAERFLHAISNPNVAYILLALGSLGILAEIFNPGALFPGITGAISLLLAFYALGVLDANLGGALLILLAFGLFIAELLTPGFGVLTAGGLVAFVLGSLILFRGGGPLFTINPWLIAIITIFVAAFVIFAISRVVQAHRRPASTGIEELIGKTAVTKTALDPEGTVLVEGERWTAVSQSGRVEPGVQVIINKVNGLTLYVTKKQEKEGK